MPVQYRALKEKYTDCILLFQVGDFYETFEQDAVLTAQLLDITLTKRQNTMDMAGFLRPTRIGRQVYMLYADLQTLFGSRPGLATDSR